MGTTGKKTIVKQDVNNSLSSLNTTRFSPQMLMQQLTEKQSEHFNQQILKVVIKQEFQDLEDREGNILEAVKYWRSLNNARLKKLALKKEGEEVEQSEDETILGKFFASNIDYFNISFCQNINTYFNRLFIKDGFNSYQPKEVKKMMIDLIVLNNQNEWRKVEIKSLKIFETIIKPLENGEISKDKAIIELFEIYNFGEKLDKKLNQKIKQFLFESYPIIYTKYNLSLKDKTVIKSEA